MTTTPETVNSRLVGYIRTYVPMAVGAALSLLIVYSPGVTGILDGIAPGWQSTIAITVTLLAQLGYYTLVRWLAKRWPWVEKLLGSSLTPVYVTSHLEDAVSDAAALAGMSADASRKD